MKTFAVRALAPCFAIFISVIASAATVEYRVLIDADNSTATGCPVTTPAVTEAGIDHVLITTVDTATNTVTKVERQQCTGGILGARTTVDAGGWSAGGNSDGSSWKVETFIPSSVLGSPVPSSMRFYFVYVNGATASAVTSNANGLPVMWPPIVGRRHAVAPPETGGGSGPRSIVLDGSDQDWAGVAPLVNGAASFGNSAARFLDISAFGTNSRIFFLFRARNETGSGVPPVANNDTYSVKQGHNLAVVAPGVLANDTDPNGLPLTAAVVSTPGSGTLNLNPDGGFTYQNNGSSLPSDSFQYKANNGTTDSTPATVTINVSPDNPPKAFADSYSIAHGGTLNVVPPGVLGNDFDLDGDVMTALTNTPPAHGTLTLNANGSFTYKHDGSNTLSDSFTYKATDGIIPSTPATVSITVGPDAAPVAVNDAYTVAEGGTLVPTGLGVFTNDTDVDTPVASWTLNIIVQPAHGTLTPGPGGTFTYVHDGSETTSDSFTYQVNDGILNSNTATVSITVTPVNDAPVATTDAYTTNEDQTLNVPAPGVLQNDTDAEGNSLTAAKLTNPSKGTVTVNANGSFQYVPNANANGSDSFTYTVTDNGTTNGSPDPKSATGTVNITITPVNDVPSFTAGGTVTVNEDSGVYSQTWATAISKGPADESGQTLNFIVSNNNNGLFSSQPSISPAGLLTFTPAPNANGTATVDVQLHDDGGVANGGVDTTTLVQFTINVTAVNDVPSFTKGLDQSVPEDAGLQTVNGWATAISKGPADESGQTVNFIVSNNNNALFGVQPAVSPTGVLTYTPAPNASGIATVSVQIHDDGGTANGGNDTSVAQTFTITITAVNDAPVITRPATASTNEDTPLAFTAANLISVADIDAGSGTLALTLSVTNGTLNLSTTTGLAPFTGNGTATINATGNLTDLNAALATLTYSPAADYSGAATLTININDNGNTGSGGAQSDNKSVAITVNPVNDAPVLTAGATLGYTENGAPAAIDTTITVNDVDNATLASATVQITANYVNGQDILAFANTPNISGSFNAATGTLTLTGTDTLAAYQTALRSVTYSNTSDNPSTAPRTVTWIGNDGALPSAPVTSTITITAVNDAPVVTAGGTLNYTENQSATAVDSTVTITDSDSTNLVGATVQITTNYVNGQDILAFTNTANITGSFNAATGTLTLSGTDTVGNYQNALRSVTYNNTSENPSSSARTVTWQVNDGGAANNLSNTPTSTINVTPVNDAPVVATSATLNYTENQAPAVLDNTITVSDADNTNLTGATIAISANYVNGQDVLAFTNTPNITGVFTPGTGVLTLTGTDTVANYQAALRTITYTNLSDNPSTAARTVGFVVNDGTDPSNTATVQVNVTAVNDAPVLTAGGTLSYTENQAPAAIDTTITISDVDSATLAGATVQLTANYVNGQDILAFTNTANITGSFNAATGTLTLSGSDTLANYQTALRSVTYNNTSENPSNAARTVTWQVNDGGAANNLSNTATSTVNVTPVNDAPVVTAGGTLTYTEADPASVIDNTITVSDVDNTNLASATVQITGNYASGQDVLSFTNTPNISGSFTAATGTLTLTGTDTLANYQAALRAVKYNNTSNSPSTALRTVTWIVNDGTTPSAGATSTITVISVNTAPTVTAGATLSYTENQAAAVVDNTVTVSDPDTATLVGATVTISSNYVNGEDVLSFVNTPQITGSFNAATGTLTLTGTDTLANYQTALRSVKYNNTSDNPSSSARTVSWRVDDGDSSNNLSNIATSTINVTPVNDAPVVTVAANLSYTENDPATAISPAATVTDVDNTTLTGATVSITGNFNTGQDVLAATGNGTISASYNSVSGVLTLSGTDTVANYQSVLRTVTYQNTSDSPTPATRTVSWVATDGVTPSTVQNTTINITSVNDAPVITAGATLSYTENQAATAIDTTITVSDADNANLASATVTISANYVNGEDVLSFVNTPNITGSFNAATGTLTLTGSDTVANYQTALRSVKYNNTSENPSGAARTISWQVNDGTSPSNTATSTVNVTPVNDAPVVTAGNTLSYTENQAASAVSPALTVTDVDNASLTGATAQITSNYVNGEDVLSFTNTPNITGSFNAATGTMTLSGTDTVANYQAAMRTILYVNTSENPSTAARTVSWIATDGITPSSTVTSTINVTSVNDAPVVTAGGTLTYTEADPASVVDNTVTVSDVDNANLASATVQITGNYANGQDVLSFVNTPNISGSFTAATGTLTLTGTDTLANYQAALRSVKYNNTSTSPSGATRTVTWIVNDGTTPSAGATSTITVISVNTAPTVTAGGTLNYTENQAATVVDNTVTVSDPDTATLVGATVTISSNYVNGEDVLSFVNTPQITGSFNAATGTLTLTGTDTLANYQTALRSVKYNNTSDNPSSSARTVSWRVDDGDSSNNLSNIATSTINVTPVNDAPVVTVAANLSYTENDPATAISPAATVTDVDNTTLTGATVSITGNFNTGQDVLAATGNGTISASYNSVSGVLTLSGTDTVANYQSVLRTVTYQNTSDNPTPATRTVSWVATDGVTPSTVQNTTINITSVNDAPVITAGATLSYTENQAATAIDTTITVSDADNANLASATVTISANYVNGEDVLSFVNTPQITGSFNAATGTLTLTGSDTLANYQTALRNVKYNNTSDNPSTAARTISWQVNDGALPSNTATSTINVTAVNDAPVVTAGNTLSYTENQPASAVSPALTVTDADSANLTGATAQITSNYVNGQDVLSFTNTPNITGSFNAATGTMTLSGTDTVANYQAAMRAILYVNTSENPSTAARTVSWIATDGITPSSTVTSTINVTSVNDAPVVTAGGTLSYTENQAATAIDTTITVSDVDNANLATATVTISANYVNGQDVLSFTNTPQITGNFVAATGVLTLTGSDTVANYQTALRNVKYNNTSDNPSTAPRTISWVANDGTTPSAAATSTINVTSVNDAPVVTAGGTLNYTEDQVATAIDGALTVTDADSANLVGATVVISANYVNGQDILSFTNTANITGVFTAASGTMTLTGTDTVANYQAALRAVKYNNTSQAPSTSPRTVQWQVNDGQGVNNLSTVVTSTINVTSVNDAPVLTAGATLAYTENDPATVIDNTITVSDVDSANLTGATVQITGNYQNGQDILSFVTIGSITNGGFNAATGTLTLTGTDTLANYQAALRTVKYTNTSENPSALARTVTWIGNDGAGVNNLSTGVTSTINVTPVNDPPVLANTATLAYTENNAATAINTAITVTDVDSTNLAFATVQITTNYNNGQDVLSFTNTPQITGVFNAATGTMTLTGSDTVANYQTALRNVKYNNTSDDPTTNPRTVVYQVDDGGTPLHASNTLNSTINVTAVNDPPTAFAYTNLPAQAGIAITYPAGKLGGSDLEAGTTITIDTTPINLTNIGSITINANGSFTVTPLPGSAGGTASFQYRVSDNGNPAPGVNGSYVTVSFAVAGPAIYFVKNPAVGLANCTLGNECLLATAVANIAAGTNANIFISDANAHTGAATIVLNSGGTIVGQGLTGFASFDAFYNISAPAQGVLAARPAIGLANPSVNTTVTLNTNSQLRGFNMTLANNTSGITANAKSGLQIDLGTITTNTPGGATTFSVDISGGSSGTLFNFGAVAANGNGANTKAVNFVATSTTTVTFSTVTSVNNTAVTVASSGATNFTFGNISTSGTGAGVNVSTTTGNFTFANVTTTAGAAVTTSGTGAGTFIFGTVQSTTGIAVSVTTATGSYTFNKINANGGAKGISVNSLTGSGSFTVNGPGGSGLCDSTHLVVGTDCMGGKIQSISGRGAEFINANNVTLKNMHFLNANTTNGVSPVSPSTCGDLASVTDDNTGCSAAVFLQNVAGAAVPGVSMDKLYLDGGVQMGINGNNVTGFSLTNSSVINFGNEVKESGVNLKNLFGTAVMTNLTLQNDWAWPLRIQNNAATGTAPSLTITNVTFNGLGKANTNSQDGFLFGLSTGATGGATVNITTSKFYNNHAYGSQFDDARAAVTSPLTVTFNNNDFGQTNGVAISNANSNGIALTMSQSGQLDYTINNNRLYGQDVVGIVLTESGTSTASSRISGTISNNTIGDNAVANSGAGTNGNGIQINGQGAGAVKANITSNTISQVQNTGINIETMTGNSQGVFHIKGNTLNPAATINNFAISVWSGNLAADSSDVCAEIGGPTASEKNIINGTWASNVGIRLRHRFGGAPGSTTYRVSGFNGVTSSADSSQMDTYVTGNNTLNGKIVSSSTQTTFLTGGGTCAAVTP